MTSRKQKNNVFGCFVQLYFRLPLGGANVPLGVRIQHFENHCIIEKWIDGWTTFLTCLCNVELHEWNFFFLLLSPGWHPRENLSDGLRGGSTSGDGDFNWRKHKVDGHRAICRLCGKLTINYNIVKIVLLNVLNARYRFLRFLPCFQNIIAWISVHTFFVFFLSKCALW